MDLALLALWKSSLLSSQTFVVFHRHLVFLLSFQDEEAFTIFCIMEFPSVVTCWSQRNCRKEIPSPIV